MPTNPGVSEVVDKDGVTADIEAKRFDGTRTVNLQGDVSGTQTWNGDSSTPLTLNASIGAMKVTRDKINDKAVGTAQIDDDAVGLTQIDDNAMTSTATAGDNRLITSGGVRTEIDNAVLNRGKDYPPMTPSQINAITETIPTGSKVHVTESGTITDGNIEVRAGEDLKYYRDGNTHYWYSLDGEFKLKQNQKSIQNLGTTKTITSLSQDENGEITASPSEIQRASTSQEGLVQLTDSHTSTSTTTAATPKNVKEAYDLANGKYSKPSGGIPKSDLASGVQASIDKADSALQGVKLAGASSALTPDADKVVTVPNAVPTGTGETNGLMTAADKAKLDGITSGANKVEASNTNGNIKIDGVETNVYTHPDAGPSSTTSVGDTTNQTPAFGGTFKAISQTVNTDGHTTATSEHTVTLPTDGKDLTSTVVNVDNYTNPGTTATALKTLFGKIWNFIGRLRTSWQTTPDDTHFPSEKLVKESLDAKADADKVVALTDAIRKRSNEAGNGWGKIADIPLANVNKNTSGSFDVFYISEDTFIEYQLQLTIRSHVSGNLPIKNLFKLQGGIEKHANFGFKLVTRGVVGDNDSVVELWCKAAKTYCTVGITQRSGNGISIDTAKDWKFYNVIGGGEAEPVADAQNNVQVFDLDTLVYKHTQTAVSDPTASGTTLSFISGITQNENGEITPTKKSVAVDSTPTASSSNPVSSGGVKDSLDAISTAAGAEAEVTAAALDDLDARMRSVEDAVNSDNIGDKIADSFDAQVLKIGGENLTDLLGGKVDKEVGKGLSTNDFTDTYKSNVDANTQARHSHSNKTVLDGISSSDVDNWNAKQASLDFMTDTDVDNLFTAAWNAANS